MQDKDPFGPEPIILEAPAAYNFDPSRYLYPTPKPDVKKNAKKKAKNRAKNRVARKSRRINRR